MFEDPFKDDTSKYKDLLDRDTPRGLVEDVQVIEPETILDEGTVKGLPPSIFKAAQEQAERMNISKEKRDQVAKVISQLFSDLDQKYGLNVILDFDQKTEKVSYLIDPVNKKAAEYYLSIAYGAYRIALYKKYLQAIALLSEQVLDPNYILSESMTYDQKLDTLERLYGFMNTMNEIYEKVNIPDTSMKLEKIKEDQQPQYKLNSPDIQKFMEDTFNEVKSTKTE